MHVRSLLKSLQAKALNTNRSQRMRHGICRARRRSSQLTGCCWIIVAPAQNCPVNAVALTSVLTLILVCVRRTSKIKCYLSFQHSRIANLTPNRVVFYCFFFSSPFLAGEGIFSALQRGLSCKRERKEQKPAAELVGESFLFAKEEGNGGSRGKSLQAFFRI